MSVAFRREGDDEHLEPKFELPIPPGPNLVTARGLQLIEARLAGLEQRLSGESDEEARKATLRQLRYWSTRAATAQLVEPRGADRVGFGSTVTIELKGKPRTFTLVGDDEADPAQGLLAFSAPLARAVMGAEPGDLVDFGGEEEAIEVIAIRVL